MWARVGLALVVGCLVSCGGPPPTPPERLAQEYFDAIGRQAYEEVLPLYSSHFFEKTSREQWTESLANVQRTMGTLVSYRAQRPFQPPEEGPEGSYRQTLVYIVEYSRFKAEETMTFFQAPSGGPLNILGHNIRYLEGS